MHRYQQPSCFPLHQRIKTRHCFDAAAASIIFSKEKMAPIIKGGLFSRAAFSLLVATRSKVK